MNGRFMPSIVLSDIYDLAGVIYDGLHNSDILIDSYNNINIIADYDIVSALFVEYIRNTEHTYAELVELNDYNSDYIISFDAENGIWIDKINPSWEIEKNDITYIYSNMSSRYVTNNKDAFFVEFSFEHDDSHDLDVEFLNLLDILL